MRKKHRSNTGLVDPACLAAQIPKLILSRCAKWRRLATGKLHMQCIRSEIGPIGPAHRSILVH